MEDIIGARGAGDDRKEELAQRGFVDSYTTFLAGKSIKEPINANVADTLPPTGGIQM